MNDPTSGEKPFDASFANSDRYSAAKGSSPVTVTVEGDECHGQVLGRNGPRTQVRYEKDGRTYVRWFDSDQVSEQ